MANRATAAFVFSVIGAAYQTVSPGVASLVDRSTSLYFYLVGGFSSMLLVSLIVFWSASHMLEDWKGRITWPTIILALAIANLSNIILAYLTPNLLGILNPYVYATLSVGTVLSLIPGPLVIMIGGILGFAAVRQYSREHGRVVSTHL